MSKTPVVFLKSQSYTCFMWQVHESTARNAIPATSRSIECSSQSIPGRSGESSSLNHLNPRMSVIFMGKITQIIHCHVWLPNLWEFQDPKREVLYHIRPYFVRIFPYIGNFLALYIYIW